MTSDQQLSVFNFLKSKLHFLTVFVLLNLVNLSISVSRI